MPTALITGGAGFIGSHVAERFLAEGWTVHIMDNLVTENEEGEVPTFLTDLTAVGLYVNKSLFDEAGVAYPTTADQIWTWDEFIAAVKEVKAATGARAAVSR